MEKEIFISNNWSIYEDSFYRNKSIQKVLSTAQKALEKKEKKTDKRNGHVFHMSVSELTARQSIKHVYHKTAIFSGDLRLPSNKV